MTRKGANMREFCRKIKGDEDSWKGKVNLCFLVRGEVFCSGESKQDTAAAVPYFTVRMNGLMLEQSRKTGQKDKVF